MVKTHRTIQQWDRWLGHFPGQEVLRAEEKFLPHLLTQYYGKHALLIGTPHQAALLKASTILFQTVLSPLNHRAQQTLQHVESSLNELPIASGSIDLVILPHTLEFLDNPRQLLAEACRIVKPEGHLIICGFNPYSSWGLRKLLNLSKSMPWSGNFIKTSHIKKWLGFADFQLVEDSTLMFRPPVMKEKLFKKLKFLEWLGSKCYPAFGGIYVLVAQAKVIPLTPIKLRWQQQLSSVTLPPISIPRPSTRNPST